MTAAPQTTTTLSPYAQSLLVSISACLGGATGKDGELALSQQASLRDSGYVNGLTDILLEPSVDLAHRQLAALSLKGFVDTHWSAKSERFTGPEPSEETKHIIKSRITQGLTDPNPRLRVAVAYVIAKIAHYDWPETWPRLFDELLGLLKSGAESNVHGALRVLTEFIREDITDEQFPYIAPTLLPELYAVFCREETYSNTIRAKCLGIFRDFSETLFMMKEERPDVLVNYLAPMLPAWMGSFKTILEKPSAGVEPEEVVLRHEVLRTLVKLTRAFPKETAPYLLPFLQLIWTHLSGFASQYVRQFVLTEEEDDLDAYVDSDGDSVGLETMLFSMLEFVGLATRKKGLKSLMTQGKGTAGEFLNLLCGVLLKYMQMTATMESKWASDMNQFIQDDEEEALNFNIRIAVEELLQTLLEIYPLETTQAICHAAQEHFQQSTQLMSSGDKHWWKIDEATLLALGRIKSELVSNLDKVQFDLSAVFDHVVQRAVTCQDFPFLQGRALWFASQYASILPPHLIKEFLSASNTVLQNPNTGPVAFVFALKTIRSFCAFLPKEVLAPYQAGLLESMARWMAVAQDEALILLLETLVLVVKIGITQYEHVIGPLLVNVWSRGTNDIMIIEMVTELFTVLARDPSSIRSLEERMVPVFLQVLDQQNANKEPGVVSTALELMTILVKYTLDPIPPIYTGELFTRLMLVLLVTDDSAILQNGQELLKFTVERDFPGIAKWTDGQKTGVEYLIKFIANLLDPSQSESSAIFVGELIVTLVRKAGQDLLPVLPELLTAVIQRLATAKMPSFVQTLVLVFAHYVQTQLDTVLLFLQTIMVNGQDGLTVLLTTWCDNHDSFQGFHSIKVSAVALSVLFMSQDARIAHIQVKGDLVTSQPGKIVTRSMARSNPDTYSKVPVFAKILKLLIAELDNRIDAEAMNAGGQQSFGKNVNHDGEGDDDEGDEWDDLEDELDDLADEDGFDFEEIDEEPIDKNDPMYRLDLKQHLMTFFKTCARDSAQFSGIAEQFLSNAEKSKLSIWLSS